MLAPLSGWAVGGDNTSAYMLVYVRECDLPKTMLDLTNSEDNVRDAPWLLLVVVVVFAAARGGDSSADNAALAVVV